MELCKNIEDDYLVMDISSSLRKSVLYMGDNPLMSIVNAFLYV